MIGIISSLIAFCITFMLSLFFSRIRNRKTRKMKLQKVMDGVNNFQFKENKKSSSRNRKIYLPWWFKIFIYIISLTLMGVSIAITFLKGKFCFFKIMLFNLMVKSNFKNKKALSLVMIKSKVGLFLCSFLI